MSSKSVVLIPCSWCNVTFARSLRQINENRKLGNQSYCSKKCQYKSRLKRKTFVCENKDCSTKFTRSPRGVSLHNYCSASCAAIINNRLFPKRPASLKKCARFECDKTFKKPTIYCSTGCQGLAVRSHKPEELIRILKTKAIVLGRTPAKRELSDIVAAVVNTFGSWNDGTKAAGLKPHRSDSERMYKRKITKAIDGHKCDSISEAIIDNWLTHHDIKHSRDAKYPDTGHKADWRIGDNTFLEYFGLANDSERYDKDIEKKKELCRKHGIRLIALYPKDLYPTPRLEQKLKVDSFLKSRTSFLY